VRWWDGIRLPVAAGRRGTQEGHSGIAGLLGAGGRNLQQG